jgi:SAM-dependent methyltransferase
MRETIESSLMFLQGAHVGKLLDVGCGSGKFLNRMRLLGWIPFGTDLDPDAVEYMKTRYQIDGLAVSAEKMEFQAETFDAITLNHSIEHLHDPLTALVKCERFLKPGGTLSIKTPNLDSMGYTRFREAWIHLDPPRHLHLFSLQTLVTCIRRAGLVVRNWRTLELGASWAYMVSREIRRSGCVSLRDSPPTSGIRSFAFLLEESFVRRLRGTAGEELVVVATKIPQEVVRG